MLSWVQIELKGGSTLKIDEIEVGTIVQVTYYIHTPGFGPIFPPGTPGIVVAIKKHDDVYVEFEVMNTMTSEPVLCHPVYLQPVS
mgnify:CR=1 FL=1